MNLAKTLITSTANNILTLGESPCDPTWMFISNTNKIKINFPLVLSPCLYFYLLLLHLKNNGGQGFYFFLKHSRVCGRSCLTLCPPSTLSAPWKVTAVSLWVSVLIFFFFPTVCHIMLWMQSVPIQQKFINDYFLNSFLDPRGLAVFHTFISKPFRWKFNNNTKAFWIIWISYTYGPVIMLITCAFLLCLS